MGLFCDINLIKLVSAIQHATELEEINLLSGYINLLKHDPTWDPHVTTLQFDAHHHWLVGSKVEIGEKTNFWHVSRWTYQTKR